MTDEATDGSDRRTISLHHPSGATARVAPHGAQVVSWTAADGIERLYLSRRARWAPDAAIRGGIPVIFPQFADLGPLPKHGLVRSRPWAVVSHDGARASFRITDDETTRRLWPYRFVAALSATIGADTLTVQLEIANPGDSAFPFTVALHNYFHVDDVAEARVVGLSGLAYRDKTRGGIEAVDYAPELAITGETDRVYADGPREVLLGHVRGMHATAIAASGFGDWVVWNPWRDGAAALTDMEPDDWRRMVCVEAARVATPVTLVPGERWVGSERLRAS